MIVVEFNYSKNTILNKILAPGVKMKTKILIGLMALLITTTACNTVEGLIGINQEEDDNSLLLVGALLASKFIILSVNSSSKNATAFPMKNCALLLNNINFQLLKYQTALV